MNIFRPVLIIFRNALYNAERDKIQDKMDHFDQRLDPIERDLAVVKEQIQALHQVSTANLEVIEQKVNATNATMQALDLIVKHHMGYMEKVVDQIKESLKCKN